MNCPGLPTDPLEVARLVREGRPDDLVGMEASSYNLHRKLRGRIRSTPEEFVACEVMRDGSVATTMHYRARSGGDVPIYVLSKRNLDTRSALNAFSSALGLKPWEISYLGLKDKRALTFQFVSTTRPQRGAPSVLRGKQWQARLHYMSDKPLRPADLSGNMFWTYVRLHKAVPVDRLQAILSEFKSGASRGGMLNFFGYQRFGGRRPINHIAGYLIAKREYEAAVRVILGTPSISEGNLTGEARRSFLEENSRASLLHFARSHLLLDRSLAKNMIRHGGDGRKSVLGLPTVLLRFLLESFSAFIFNRCVSHMRDELLRDEVLKELLYVPLDERGVPLMACAAPTPSSTKIIEDEIRRGKATAALTCPGYLVGKIISSETMAIMDELGVTCGSFFLQERPEVGFPGQLRAATVVPRVISATAVDEFTALLSFFLPRSSYATVFLRELLHA